MQQKELKKMVEEFEQEDTLEEDDDDNIMEELELDED